MNDILDQIREAGEQISKNIADMVEDFKKQINDAYQKGFEDGKKSVSEPDRIEVGDEVKAPFGTAVVVCCDYDADKASYVYSSGRHGFDNTWNLKKTGKHYDIQSILEAMRK